MWWHTIVCALSVSGTERIDKHQQLTRDFEHLNFFYEGRGMTLSPDFVDLYEILARLFGLSRPQSQTYSATTASRFEDRWGLIDHDQELKGFFNISYNGMNVGALGCVACHSGKAAGIYIPGLGNKNIDPWRVGHDAHRALTIWKWLHPFRDRSGELGIIESLSIDFAKRLAQTDYSNLTQGMVPVALIQQWFYRQAGQEIPKHHPRGAVKVPHFWGYGEKRKVGQFCDGFGDGERPGWGLLVELTGGQTVDGAQALMSKVSSLEDRLSDLLPPPYPFAIDQGLAENGKKTFETYCMGCHGSYHKDSDGLAIYQAPKLIALSTIATDPERLQIITPEFLDLVDSNPLASDIRIHRRTPAYFAPRLEGIWSRFPYLHNGSVPSIRALMTAPDFRPKAWSLKNAGERSAFDERDLGLKLSGPIPSPHSQERSVYSTLRPGHSNQGHWFKFSSTLSPTQVDGLIEYLKTL